MAQSRAVTTLASFRLPRPCRRTLAALAPIVLTGEVEELGLVEAVVDDVELFMRSIPGAVRAGVVAGLVAFEQSARGVPSSLGRGFSALDPAGRAAHFERWWQGAGPLHQLARGLKMFLSFAYYERPEVKARLGYDPERWIARVKREREARHAEAIAAAEALVLAPDPLVARPAARRGARELPRATA